jgi:hypothetical protein
MSAFQVFAEVRRSKHGILMKTGQEGRSILAFAQVESKNRPVGGIMLKCVLMIFGYITFGWLWFKSRYGWTYTDCFYFAMVTVTTVGFGDLTPDDKFIDQLFVGIYAFCGVAIIAAMVSDLAGASIDAIEKAVREAKKNSIEKSNELIAAARRLGADVGALHEGGGIETGKKKKVNPWLNFIRWHIKRSLKKYGHVPVKLVILGIQLVLAWEVGAILLQITEGYHTQRLSIVRSSQVLV